MVLILVVLLVSLDASLYFSRFRVLLVSHGSLLIVVGASVKRPMTSIPLKGGGKRPSELTTFGPIHPFSLRMLNAHPSRPRGLTLLSSDLVGDLSCPHLSRPHYARMRRFRLANDPPRPPLTTPAHPLLQRHLLLRHPTDQERTSALMPS